MTDYTKKTIVCQHGTNECYGNRIHACAIRNNTQATWMNFIGCDIATSRPYNDTIGEEVSND